MQKNAKLNEPTPADLYSFGTLSHIERMIKSDGEINAQIRGLSRVKIVEYHRRLPYLIGKNYKRSRKTLMDTPEIKALTNHLANEFKKAINLGKFVDFLVFMNVMSENTPSQLADLVASVLGFETDRKTRLFWKKLMLKKRLEKIIDLLSQGN